MSSYLKYTTCCLFIILNLIQNIACAQTAKTDSLKTILSKAENDSLKCEILGELGSAFYYNGNLSESLKSYESALQLSKTLHYKKGMANSYTEIGMVLEAQGNYAEAIKNMYASLKIMEELGDQHHIVSTYVNMALVFADHGNFEKAEQNAILAINVSKKSGDNMYLGYAYNTLGVVYYYQQKYRESLSQHFLALNIRNQLEDKSTMADSYSNIGILYYELGVAAKVKEQNDSSKVYFELALQNYQAAKTIIQKSESISGMAAIHINIGSLYTELKNYVEAKKYLLIGLDLYKQIGSKEGMKEAYNGLTQLSAIQKNAKDELIYYKLYISYRDSLNNEDNTRKITQTQMQYDFDKKEAATKLEHEKKEAIAQTESKKQKIILFSISGVLLLMIAFSAFAYRSYLQKQKANEAITKQKEIIEEKQKEIVDSIHYAKRIQTALITSEKYIGRNLDKLNKS